MSTLVITRGLPGSGKSTWARTWVAEDPAHRARVNRDDLRTMLHGRRLGTAGQEAQVTAAQHAAVRALLCAGYDVVVDDTNLVNRHALALQRIAQVVGAQFLVKDFTTVPVDECIRRDLLRDGSARVGKQVILSLWERHVRGRPHPDHERS
jgi:predicted kinase